MRAALVFVLLVFAFGGRLLADEPTRCAQEELRKRNLYFGDVDGRISEEFRGALRRYQARKSLAVTGEIDEETAHSLNVPVASSQETSTQQLPDVPVLKSDVARTLSEEERVALQQNADAQLEPNAPPAPAESPSALQNVSPEVVTKFVEEYLRDAEGDDVDLQVEYYRFPLEYFDHGRVGRDFVARDTHNYVKRWPRRQYVLKGPVAFGSSSNPDEIEVQFTIGFTVKSVKNTATGQTRNFWTIKTEKNQKFKIIAIREQRSHE